MKTNAKSYRGYRFPPEIISHSVWLYHRFALSIRSELRYAAETHSPNRNPIVTPIV